MKYGIYSIRDCVTSQSNIVTFCNDAEALRTVINLSEDTKSMIYMNPDDFQLSRIGYFDEETNTLSVCEKEVLW